MSSRLCTSFQHLNRPFHRLSFIYWSVSSCSFVVAPLHILSSSSSSSLSTLSLSLSSIFAVYILLEFAVLSHIIRHTNHCKYVTDIRRRFGLFDVIHVCKSQRPKNTIHTHTYTPCYNCHFTHIKFNFTFISTNYRALHCSYLSTTHVMCISSDIFLYVSCKSLSFRCFQWSLDCCIVTVMVQMKP